jgi:hypothetical protein
MGATSAKVSRAVPAAQTQADPRWAAIVARDPRGDGKFVYAVSTTGVYCRPSCPSRPAKPEHVILFDGCEDAERAGFRACKRCRPQAVAAAQQKAEAGHARISRYDWPAIGAALDTYGCAVIDKLLTPAECEDVAALYADDTHFRSHIHMARHGFGKGEYKYFRYPLPALVGALRVALYARFAPIANGWNERLNAGSRYPDRHADYLKLCHAAGQVRPTPLLLQYGLGDFNCLHQDRYGDLVFPLQATVLLSAPGHDFTGGEFVLTEQRPRMQSRAEVVPLAQGDAVVFAVHHRPVQGAKGVYRVNLRHGVSRMRSGRRHTLGIIFHDAI